MFCPVYYNARKSAILVLLCALIVVQAQKADLACSACRVLVTELKKGLLDTNSAKETVRIGHKLDVHGNAKKIKYQGSEMHIMEVMENVCDKMNNYKAITGKDNKKKYVDLSELNGENMQLGFTGEGKDLQHTCETFLEFHDEDIEQYLYKNAPKDLDEEIMQNEICKNILPVCEAEPKEEL